MKFDEVVAYFKTGYNLHKLTGLSHNRIGDWRKKGFVPIIAQMRIEKATEGALMASFDHVNEKLIK